MMLTMPSPLVMTLADEVTAGEHFDDVGRREDG